MAANITTGVAIEGSTVYLLARVNGEDAIAIQQADLDAVDVEVWKINPPLDQQRGAGWKDKNVETPTPLRFKAFTPSVASCVFDALQTDARWTKDEVGYNFRLPLTPAEFDVIAKADHPKAQWYQATAKFTPAGAGDPFKAVFEIQVYSNLFGKS